MKKLLVGAALVIAAVAFVRVKILERDANQNLADDYFIELCGRDSACSDRLVRFRPCFGAAYRMALAPGTDTVDVDALVSCLNGAFPVPALDTARTADLPFPTTRSK